MNHWERIKVEEVATKVGSGSTPRGGSKSYKKTGIPLIRSMNVHFDGLHYDGLVFIDEDQASALKNVEVRESDVLLNITGASIGRVTQAPKEMDGARVNQHVCIIRPRKELNSKFLSQYLASPAIQKMIMSEEYGVTRQALTKQGILNFEIPLPPLNEQHRIVAKIEALTARSRKARAALDAIPALLDQFRQSVLAAAFRGDLTADWRAQNPDVEPAETLLARIRTERRARWEAAELEKMKAKGKVPKNDKWKEKYKEPSRANQEDFPELPEDWFWISVEELVSDKPRSLQSGPFGSNLKHHEFQDSGILAIGIDNVLEGEFTLGRQNRISSEKYKELEKYTARPLDVLITVMATVGRCCVVPEGLETSIITKHVYRASPEQQLINSYFFMNALRGDGVVLAQIEASIRGQTRPGINGQILKKLVIPIPPKSEQEKILEIIERQFLMIEEVEALLHELNSSTDQLDQSILAKAFRGQLVPQDPNDEPASVLLERIRAEREKTQKKKGKGGKGKGKRVKSEE